MNDLIIITGDIAIFRAGQTRHSKDAVSDLLGKTCCALVVYVAPAVYRRQTARVLRFVDTVAIANLGAKGIDRDVLVAAWLEASHPKRTWSDLLNQTGTAAPILHTSLVDSGYAVRAL